MAKKTKKPVATAVEPGVGPANSPPVDASHRKFLDLAGKKPLSDDEWTSIRQCLRCLLQEKRLVKVGDGPRQVADHKSAAKNKPTSTLDAINQVIEQAKRGKCSFVEAARQLTFVDVG